jgi:signal transduction histidine kinase
VTVRADRLFRFVGVTGALWAIAPTLIALVAQGPEGFAASVERPLDDTARMFFWGVVTAVMLFAVAVAAIFWWLTATPRPWRHSWLRLAAVVMQGVMGILGGSQLLILVAAELPFVLAPRAARLYLVVQLAIFVTFGISIETVVDSKPLLDVLPALLVDAGWPVAAFLLGGVAVREAKQRRERAQLNAELGATRELLVEGSRLAERLHLSRELHDSLGHRLAALSVNLDLAGRLAQGEPAGALREAHAEARRLYQEVRDVVSALRRDSVIDMRQALAVMAAGFVAPPVTVESPSELTLDGMPRAYALLQCLRVAIAQAATAQATEVTVAANPEADGLRVEIRDDRPQRERARAEGARSELERCLAEVGGSVAGPRPLRDGWSLELWLPRGDAAG